MKQIVIEEVGLREGLQSNPKILTFEEKVRLVDGFIEAGIRRIQLGSFVNPKRIPQMAGVEQLFEHYKGKKNIIFSALVLNKKGLERAMSCGVKMINISLSASDSHQRENVGKSIKETLPIVTEMIGEAKRFGMRVRAGVQAAFGCYIEGQVPIKRVIELCNILKDAGADELNLADTAGFGSPGLIRELLQELRGLLPDTPIGLHLHNTLGMGLANVISAIHEGVTLFDSAIIGLGGCPFMKGAEGNIATEDLVFLLQSLGEVQDIDLDKLCKVASYIRDIYRSSFNGKVCKHYHKLLLLGLWKRK